VIPIRGNDRPFNQIAGIVPAVNSRTLLAHAERGQTRV